MPVTPETGTPGNQNNFGGPGSIITPETGTPGNPELTPKTGTPGNPEFYTNH